MGLQASLSSTMQNFALTWLPVMFFLLMCVVVVPALPDDEDGAARQADRDHARLVVVGHLERGGGARRGQGGAEEVVDFLRDPKRFERLGARVPKGILLPRAARDRQDAGREGGRERVGRALLRPERLGVRRDVRRARRGPHPQALRRGAQERPGDRLHRRARRGRPGAQRPRVQPRAGPDPEPAPRRARRLRLPRPGRRHGRLEPAPGPRPGAPAARPLRPPDPRSSRRI